MEKIDIAIIGGGVIGLAVASVLAREDKDVFILEKNTSFGQETSSRNSEVIHSGIYYPEDSLKTSTCVEGSRLLYEICGEHGIGHKKTGKLIVARDASEIAPLEELFKQGQLNGLEGLRMISSEEAGEMEPNVKAERAIYLPMTGIVDSHALMEFFLSKARSGGADIIYDAEVKSIARDKKCYRITTAGVKGEKYLFETRMMINCAGLNSDLIARMAGIDDQSYALSYCKGDYFRVGNGKNRLVKRLVYPVVRKDDTSLGIHATPDLSGGMRLGPDAEYTGTRDLNYEIDPAKRRSFYDGVKAFLPFVEEEDLSPDTSGIRPKLQGQGEGFRDFIIRHEADRGLEGFINLIGIESPGLTASPAIAEMVRTMVQEIT